MNPFISVKGAITIAFVIAVIVSLILTASVFGRDAIGFHHAQIDRWLHIVAGVTWIGLLYVVQVPVLAGAAADQGGSSGEGVSKGIAPSAVWWARSSPLLTWITGAYLLLFGYGPEGAFHKAFTLQPGFVTIGVGAWLGTIMLLNLWGLIRPNQKKVLVAATHEERAKARKVVLYASRTNFILSVPMLMCMGAQGHGLPF